MQTRETLIKKTLIKKAERKPWWSIWISHHYFGVTRCVLRDCDPIFRLFPLRGLVVYVGDDDSEVDRAAPTPSVCSDDLLADPWCLSGWETGDIIQPRGLSAYTEIIQVVTDTSEDRWGFLSTGIPWYFQLKNWTPLSIGRFTSRISSTAAKTLDIWFFNLILKTEGWWSKNDTQLVSFKWLLIAKSTSKI